ncbi:MAG: hypothetical protein O7D30_05235 [Rickettsia endosymbiont of Ixodes persulcatus]|nr:hypothetical protein [Rickettsia endosymbiont of Ixodes persulcatus]
MFGRRCTDTQGNIKFYTENEAYELGKQLAKIAKDQNMILLTTNGSEPVNITRKLKKNFRYIKKEDQLDEEKVYLIVI